ncbi:MAG: divalent-cation tolerance protein CutA [Alphaproteobacteria bacterium]|nr:divalent-cation tolerance protein CutA [Rickettsiales bacterium]
MSKKLASCIQIQDVESHYIWKEEIQGDKEFLLFIKTKKELYKEVETEILKYHSYEVPQIISLKIDEVYKEYESWTNKALERWIYQVKLNHPFSSFQILRRLLFIKTSSK